MANQLAKRLSVQTRGEGASLWGTTPKSVKCAYEEGNKIHQVFGIDRGGDVM
jgi:hypothetical protein